MTVGEHPESLHDDKHKEGEEESAAGVTMIGSQRSHNSIDTDSSDGESGCGHSAALRDMSSENKVHQPFRDDTDIAGAPPSASYIHGNIGTVRHLVKRSLVKRRKQHVRATRPNKDSRLGAGKGKTRNLKLEDIEAF